MLKGDVAVPCGLARPRWKVRLCRLRVQVPRVAGAGEGHDLW